MRTIIEKYQRLASIQERYAEQITNLAEKQLSIHQKVLKDLGLDNHYDHRDIMRYDFLRVNSDASVDLWETGRCGDGDSTLGTIYIHSLIIKGDAEGYEQDLRTSLKVRAEQAVESKKKENERRRESLQAELGRISNELGKLGGQS